jgi:tetratricopeptide (TPR) repeat protein
MVSESNGNEEIGRFEAQYRRNPDSLVFARLADAYRKAGDPERGLSLLADGIGRHPDYPSAHIVRARCLVDLDRLAAAEASLRRVIELDGQNLVAMQGLAGLAERRDDAVEAVRWYEQIAALDPMNIEAEAALARLRPTPPPTASMEPLPAPTEEWWSSPAFQIESEAEVPAEEPPQDVAEEVTGAVGAPEGPAAEDPGTAWWFEDPGDDEPADDGDLLTRTMADLYIRQGLLDEAAAIYRELLTDRPDDEELRRALHDLERRTDGADAGANSEDVSKGDVDAASESAAASESDAEPEPIRPESALSAGDGPASSRAPTDPFATHPVPPTAGTGAVFGDWLRRLAE